MKYIRAVVAIALSAIFAATALTIWATGKSHERTACYRAAQSIDGCEQPNAVERAIRFLLAPESLKPPNANVTGLAPGKDEQ